MVKKEAKELAAVGQRASERLTAVEQRAKEQCATMEEVVRKAMPWLFAEPRIEEVAMRAMFPRTISGKYQTDELAMRIFFSNDNRPVREALLKPVAKGAPSYRELFDGAGIAHTEAEPAILKEIADRLEHLRTYKPSARDFAIEALQDAFIGLMHGEYAWGRKGLPTRGG